jgi:hypothetical protein
MRWKRYKQNDIRVIKRFLIIPTTIEYEVRWLEFAYIKQLYDGHKWVNYCFMHESYKPMKVK